MLGKFITLEGGEGVGKSTQVPRIIDELKKRGIEAIRTREPGGTEGAEKIRNLLVKSNAPNWDMVTELMLFFAARRDHVEKLIKPALAEGKWVICDRFADSSFAYQCYGGNLPLETALEQYKIALGDFWPDLTILFDINNQENLQKAIDREGEEKRFELKGLSFHEKVKQGFKELAQKFPERYVSLTEQKTIPEMTEIIMQQIDNRFSINPLLIQKNNGR